MGSKLSGKNLSAPVNVTWEMTLACNLRCNHCLSDSGTPAKDELSTDECKRLIDQLTGMHVFQVNIGGGEPFIRDDFLSLMQYAHYKGLVTCVSTNGMLVDTALAKKLAKLTGFYLQVSLDGATAEVNDKIRGRGTYKKILAAMECLAENSVRFSINTVLTRLNYPQLDDFRQLAAGFGAQLRVSRFRPSGRAKNTQPVLGPDKKQLEQFARWLELHDLVRTGDSFFCLTSEKRRRKGLDMCGAAKMTCCISPDGHVYPCAFLQENRFLAGNIRDTCFERIWSTSPIFKHFRNLEVQACKTCPRFDVCRGGCPAMAYHTYKDIEMPDPQCLVNIKKTDCAGVIYA